MTKNTILRIKVPYSKTREGYFSFQLKTRLENEPALYNAPEKMLLISGIHGDFRSLQRLLIKCRVIDRKHHWIFDKGHLVIAGDGFDKEGKGVECLWLIYSLEEKAKRAGGYVHFILGDQELKHLDGDWRHIHPNYADPVNRRSEVTALYDGNNTLWQWMLTKNILEKIGDIIVMPPDVYREIDRLQQWINKNDHVNRRYHSFIRRLLNNPLLMEDFKNTRSDCIENVHWSLNWAGVRTIVLGREIMETDFRCFDGRVVRMNAVNTSGDLEGMLIKKDRYYRIDVNGNRERMN